jgi:glyoxylase-like metal-dependent hydrolase (beta-lactamase superfamily II)
MIKINRPITNQFFKRISGGLLIALLVGLHTWPLPSNANEISSSKSDIKFQIELLSKYKNPLNNSETRRVYVAQETNGYLQKLGAEIGVRTLIVTGKSNFLIVDPGPDAFYTKALLAALKKVEPKLPSYPEVIINSVARPEHSLGNSTLSDELTKIYSTKVTQTNMVERCPNCRKRLAESLNKASIAETPIQTPNQVITPLTGIPNYPEWQVLEFAARTKSDLVLWSPQLKIMFAGGLVSHQSVPDLTDGSVLQWLDALRDIELLQPAMIIGTGPYLAKSRITSKKTAAIQLNFTRQYLSELEKIVRKDFLAGGNEADADKCLNLEQYANIKGYKKLHPLNIQRVWREIETQEMNKSSISSK